MYTADEETILGELQDPEDSIENENQSEDEE